MQNFWCAARLMSRREAYATHCLGVEGFETYLPRLRENRTVRGRKVEVRPPLFPGYCFILVMLQWHAARWCPGVLSLIMAGDGPVAVLLQFLGGRQRTELPANAVEAVHP